MTQRVLEQVLDYKYANNMVKKYDLSVNLKKGPKGVSLFAKRPIKKGNIVSYYKFKLFPTKNFKGVKKDMYAMSVYTKNYNFNPRVIGDIFEGSLEPPKYNIPFWAYFSNEPSGNQTENCTINPNLKSNYGNRHTVKEGDTMIYKLIASKDINQGEEIVWCYGKYYNRKYEANC
jgi:hypothetical protein